MTGMKKTPRQIEIMGHILKRAGEGIFLTQVELHRELAGAESYGALRISMNFLEKHQMIVREPKPGTSAKYLKPTLLGYDWFRPTRV